MADKEQLKARRWLISLVLASIPICFIGRFLFLQNQVIELDILLPPRGNVTTTFYRYSVLIPTYLIWEGHYQVPSATFDSPEETKEYFDRWFEENGWLAVDDNVVMSATGTCSVSRIPPETLERSDLTVYTTREWLALPEFKGTLQACLFVDPIPQDGYYHVRVATIKSSPLDELNE